MKKEKLTARQIIGLGLMGIAGLMVVMGICGMGEPQILGMANDGSLSGFLSGGSLGVGLVGLIVAS